MKKTTYDVSTIGYLSLERLSTCRVIALFERSFYLKNKNNELISIINSELEDNAFSLKLNEKLSSFPKIGDSFEFKENKLVSENIILDLKYAQKLKNPIYSSLNKAQLKHNFNCFIKVLHEYFKSNQKANGFAALFYDFGLSSKNLSDDKNIVENEIYNEAKKVIENFISEKNFNLLVTKMLGLGIGLTPSGDDFLGGLLLFYMAYEQDNAKILNYEILNNLELTNSISAEYLIAATKGYGAEVFHILLQELNNDEASFDNILSRIDNIGHSSGFDTMFGILIACNMCINKKFAWWL